MADDESEGDPGPNDTRQLVAFTKKEATQSTSINLPVQNRREIWNTGVSPSNGPRSLFLKRSENGFGFTLRHFIVYPPESSEILARDRRLGLDVRAIENGPMDTIFVKKVQENSPANVAGLTTGDRIISVNGTDIAGLSYAKVIQLIHKTGNFLHLLVVPKENDILQLYFSETAHNPETNQRLRSPTTINNSVYPRRTCVNAKITNTMHHYGRSQTSPLQGSLKTDKERTMLPTRSVNVRRSSEGNNERRSEPASVSNSHCRYTPQTISDTSSCCSSESGVPYATAAAAPPSSRHSLDVGIGRPPIYDSLSDSSVKDSYGSEDSLIMSRLRKSFEQKEEFLNRLPQSPMAIPPSVSVKECRSRSPNSTAAAPWSPSQSGNRMSPQDASPCGASKVKQNFVQTLDKIQENPSNAAKAKENDGSGQPFQMVTIRTKQFEKGPVDTKTELYRSELARLSTKHNVANVAQRKRDYENRAQAERQNFATRETRSLESAYVPPLYATVGCGNRTIPIGSKKLHCEPPTDFTQLSTTQYDVTKKSESEDLADNETTVTITTPSEDKEGDDDKSKRRISYIKATTTGDTMAVDSEYEFSDSEAIITVPQRSILGSRKVTDSFPEQEQHSVIKEGPVLCKVTQVDGKRAGDRSWKPIWLTLKGPILCLYKERRESLSGHNETPATFDRPDLGASSDRIDIRCSVVEVACDYTKRKHVFRLNAPSVGAELLLQADDANSMTQWVKVLREQTLTPSASVETMLNLSSNASPNSGNKTTFRKLTSLRNRSPTGESPNSKTRKSAQLDTQQQTSPKSKNWKNKMAKQFRRIQPGSNTSNAPPAVVPYPPGATIGIPLEACPYSSFSVCVPLLVEICTEIVEAKGLEIIGIYRVPGNTAAVTSLTEAVNRGLDMSVLDQDPRWSDVNVISSLLKSFFRKLPDALLTGEWYPHFIKADRIEDPIARMATIRKLVHSLPDHNFETLKYLLFHLKKVVANSAVNKMEARNLAIVFGPTLVRNGDDMVTMVTDMSHQCRIVESLLCHVDWCFGDGNIADLKANIPDMNSGPELEATSANHNLLLNNIRKVEGNSQSPVTAKDVFSTIIGVANRKMQKTSKHLINNRKVNTTNLNLPPNLSAEDILISVSSHQNSVSEVRNNREKEESAKEVENLAADAALPNGEMKTSVTITKPIPEDLSIQNTSSNTDTENENTWTYSGLSANTQERIRRFEQETKAMLQRELSRQKRVSNYTPEEATAEKEKVQARSRERQSLENVAAAEHCSSNKKQCTSMSISMDDPNSDYPPPVVVMRRNLPNSNGKNVTAISNNTDMKRLKTGEEFARNNSLEKSGSLDSLNQAGRPSSHVSDDGGDLLMSLTTTFDRKLKSLLTEEDKNTNDGQSWKKRNSFIDTTDGGEDRTHHFRDPSLHRTLEMSLNIVDDQNDNMEINKENHENCEKTDSQEGEEIRSCVTCGCSLKCSAEAVQPNDGHRAVLQEMQSGAATNRLQTERREPKLFYSNSVKIRRSESLKEDVSQHTKLRRSGSLNKHDSRMTKIETWIMAKNGDGVKLKRTDSLTKSEKTETNMMKRRQIELSKKNRVDKDGKSRRRSGQTKGGNIKRRHTVGGTKDFDKVSWLQNQQKETNKENRKERRTSSPDLSSTRMADFFVEVVVRPRSFVSTDPNLLSRLLNIPLESHV